jgi:hypothetical protein
MIAILHGALVELRELAGGRVECSNDRLAILPAPLGDDGQMFVAPGNAAEANLKIGDGLSFASKRRGKCV